jgi:hypothetical protein
MSFDDPLTGNMVSSNLSEWPSWRGLMTARLALAEHTRWYPELLFGLGRQRFRAELLGGVQLFEATSEWHGEVHGGVGVRLFDDSQQSLTAELTLHHAKTGPEIGENINQLVFRMTLLRRVVGLENAARGAPIPS